MILNKIEAELNKHCDREINHRIVVTHEGTEITVYDGKQKLMSCKSSTIDSTVPMAEAFLRTLL